MKFKIRSSLCLSNDSYWKCSLNWTMNARKKYVFRFLDTIILLISFLFVCCSSYRDLCLRDTYNIGYNIYILINVGIFLPSACIYTILHREVVVPNYLPGNRFYVWTFFFSGSHYSHCVTRRNCSPSPGSWID